MGYLDLLKELFEVCVVPLFGVLTAYLVKYINRKAADLANQTKDETLKKYINMLDKTISEAVTATTQTYVEALKGKDAFDEEAQLEAFTKTYNAVKEQLTEEAHVYLKEIYGDIDKYIETKIEAEVQLQK